VALYRDIPALPQEKYLTVFRPLAPECYKVQFTVGADTIEKLRRAQDLLRHRVPIGDVAIVFDRALTVLLEHLEKTKLATTEHPRASRDHAQGSRNIPAAVRRQVWARDEGRCAFVGTCGRCTERGFLEFHHVRPYAAGGKAVVANIELRCRAHNQHEADLFVRGQAPPVVREYASAYGFRGTRSGPSGMRATTRATAQAVGASSPILRIAYPVGSSSRREVPLFTAGRKQIAEFGRQHSAERQVVREDASTLRRHRTYLVDPTGASWK
jgi:hypothetical protein